MGLQDDMKTLLAMDAQAQKETFTPSHPFTPDVVAWAETKIRNYESLLAGGQNGEHLADSRMSFVPEPASWSMMLAGFWLVGGMLRAASRKMGSYRPRYS